jgi:hypothetical protein
MPFADGMAGLILNSVAISRSRSLADNFKADLILVDICEWFAASWYCWWFPREPRVDFARSRMLIVSYA